MKNILAFAIAMTACAATGSVLAQTCTPSTGTVALTGANSNGSIGPFDTCTAADALNQMCSSSGTSSAPDAIWSITLGPGAISGNLTVSTSAAGYDMYVALMQGSCSGAAFCAREADAGLGGVSETIDLTSLSAGQYFLAVTSFTPGQCGPVTLTLPTLPVTLQGFSVE